MGTTIDSLIGLILLLIFGFLAGFLIYQIHRDQKLQSAFDALRRSFAELDEQARLIVKTDLELNRTQEELDKRLTGLDALQKISRRLAATLDEQALFSSLQDPSLLTALGFERLLIFSLEDSGGPQERVALSCPDVPATLEHLNAAPSLLTPLQSGRTISSLRCAPEVLALAQDIFDIRHFILAPIRAQNTLIGGLFVGNQSNAFPLTDGDEELISILSDQIGQAIDNARLFNEAYRARQILELKVQERTRQLSQALEEVQRISRMKSEFISAVSHELRTPLTSIKGYAMLLISGKMGELPDAVRMRLEKINAHSDRLVEMINGLLDISRIESGRVELKFGRHDLHKILDSVGDLLAPQIKSKDIVFSVDLPGDLPKPSIDAGQIERVFINLIGNAIKFTPPAGRISVGGRAEENRLVLTVSDTGIGIKPEDIGRLFDEFYRVENEINQNVKGTGLGLALVKKIIRAHGGDIWVESPPGEGSRFHFTLPIDGPASQTTEPRPSPDPG